MRILRSLLRWLWPALPFLLGLLTALVLHGRTQLILRLRADVAGTILLLTALASLVLTASMLGAQIKGRQSAQILHNNEEESAHARRRFLRRLDHEMKNPLTALRAALANLTDSANITENQPAILDVQRQVDRISRLTSDLRKLA